MANYQSPKKLETELEGLRNTHGSGLLQAMRNLKQRKLEKELGSVNENNDNLRNQELAMLLRGDRTGRVGDSYVARRAAQFVPRHPDLVQALRDRSQGQGQPSNVQEWEYFSKLPQGQQEQYLTMRRGASPINLGDRFVQPSQTQPGTSLGEFNVGLRPQDTPEVRGDQTAAVEQAKINAIPQAMAAETQGLVDRTTAQTQQTRSRDATNTLEILDMAAPLLEVATGSGLGAARDAALGAVGQSTEGAQAAAQLQALSGRLIMMMPRMEGPQSNMDQQLYRQMAGQIGDATIPNDTRKAAIETIRALAEKYASTQPAGAAPAGVRLRFNPATGELE